MFIFYMFLLTLSFIVSIDFRYEIYLEIAIEDRVNFIDISTIYLLSALHVIILFFMGYNREELISNRYKF